MSGSRLDRRMFRTRFTLAAAAVAVVMLGVSACGGPTPSRTLLPASTALPISSSAPVPASSTPATMALPTPSLAPTSASSSPAARSSSPSSSGFLAQSVTLLSNDDAWLLGGARCSSGWCIAIRHTIDRGRSWTAVPAPPAPLDADHPEGVSELRFADAADGFAFDPGVWATHDGAAHWHQVHLPGAVLAMASADREVYAVVAPCWPFTGSCTTPARLYRSPTGVDAWQLVAGLSLPSQLGVVLRLQGSRVFLLVEASPAPYLVGSVDGSQFGRLVDPCPFPSTGPRSAPAGLTVSTVSDLAVACSGGAAAGSEGKRVYVSADGGHTYRRIADPPLGGEAGELAAANLTTLLMTASSGASFIYRTSGADTAWTMPVWFGDGGVGFTDLGCSDPTHCAVVYGRAEMAATISANPPPHLGTLYLTDDGGATWQAAVVSE